MRAGALNLLGLQELADLLNVSRQRADQRARERDFPKPVAELKAGRIWKLADVEKWIQRREPNDRGDR